MSHSYTPPPLLPSRPAGRHRRWASAAQGRVCMQAATVDGRVLPAVIRPFLQRGINENDHAECFYYQEVCTLSSHILTARPAA